MKEELVTVAESLAPEGVDLVWFSGPDSVRFLDDLISQKIGSLGRGAVTRSLLLGPQGKLDHMLWVLRGDDLVGLVTDIDRGPELAGTLGRYRIRVKVDIEVEERPRWLVVGGDVSGGWSGDRSGSVDADLSWRKLSRRLVVGERPDMESLSVEGYELARILSGEPAFGRDVDSGTIPQEAGLVDGFVDFTKGCYLGQELVARIDSRGRVVKLLRRLELAGAVRPGDEVRADGAPVGQVTSVSGKSALATVRFEVEPGQVVAVGDTSAVTRAITD